MIRIIKNTRSDPGRMLRIFFIYKRNSAEYSYTGGMPNSAA